MEKYLNIIANILGRGWAILLTLALTPIYINTLGFEAYGLIGVFAVIQSLFAILEMGFPQALNRSVARYTGGTLSPDEISSIVKMFEIAFIGFACLILLVSVPLSHFLASSWFKFDSLPIEDIRYSLMSIFALVAFRFPIGLYLAVLSGLQQQVKANILSAFFVTLKLLGATAVITYWNNDILDFFLFQVFVSIIEIITIRIYAWHADPSFNPSAHLYWNKFKEHAKLASQIGTVTILGVLISQADKAILSKQLSLTDFGHYSLISMIGIGLITLGYPIGQASFPHFSKLIAQKSAEKLKSEFYFYLRIMLIIILPVTATLALYSQPILVLYVGQELPADIYSSFELFILASLFGALLPLPYGLLLASGKLKPVMKFYLLLAVIYPILLIIGIDRLGVVGAAGCFLGLQLISFLVFSFIAFKVNDLPLYFRFLGKSIIAPLLVTGGAAYLMYWLIDTVDLDVSIVIKAPIVWAWAIFILFFSLTTTLERRSVTKLIMVRRK